MYVHTSNYKACIPSAFGEDMRLLRENFPYINVHNKHCTPDNVFECVAMSNACIIIICYCVIG